MSDNRATIIPPIPNVPRGQGKDMERFLLAVKEAIEIAHGKRGDRTDRAVTHREITTLISTAINKALASYVPPSTTVTTDTLLELLEGAITFEQLDESLAELIGDGTEDGSSTSDDIAVLEESPGGTGGASYGAVFDGAGLAIATPVNDVFVPVRATGTITKVVVLTQGGPGDCVIGVWKDVFGSYPPTSGDSITGGNDPTITAGTTLEDSTLTGWTTSVTAGDVLGFSLASSANFTQITIVLFVE